MAKARARVRSAPQLPHWPHEAVAVAEAEIVRRNKSPWVGSSPAVLRDLAGGEARLRAVLINPAIEPHVGLRAYLGPQQAFHEASATSWPRSNLGQWKELFLTRVHPERYVLLVETGDEVLDYRRR